MARTLKYILIGLLLGGGIAQAGNEERTGEAGAYELNMDGWARTSGMFGANTAVMTGVESMRYNVAGLAHVNKTQASVSYTRWLATGNSGEAMNIMMAGAAVEVGDGNVMGFSLQSLSFGELVRTTTSNPDGNLGTFSPNFINLGFSFSREFSNSIYAGATARFISEKNENVGGTGFALDAGIQYVTGAKDNIHFGVSIRNLGTTMTYNGPGLSFRGQAPDGDFDMTQRQRTERFALPSQLNIGASYDQYFGYVADSSDDALKGIHRITPSFTFTSSSVGRDFFTLGVEYGYREMFFARVGYRFQNNGFGETAPAHIGLAAGVGAQYPITKSGNMLGIDYSYRPSNPFNGGTHSIGVRFSL